LLQYKKEAFEKYQLLMANIKNETISNLLKLNIEQYKQSTTQVIELKPLDNTEDLLAKLKQGSELAKDIE
jgi:preprotein translocase subunit SecA